MTQSLNREIAEQREIQEWLEQFDEGDEGVAIEALLSLKFVSRDEVESHLRNKMEELASTDEPVAYYTVRETEDTPYFTSLNKRAKIDDEEERRQGSEYSAASLVSEVCDGQQGRLDHTSVGQLKRLSVSDIVLVDDFSGSGARLREFLNHLRGYKGFRSALSLRCLEFHIVLHSITTQAKSTVERMTKEAWGESDYSDCITFHTKNRALDSESSGPKPFSNRCMELFRRYEDEVGGSWQSLGYGKVASNLLFEHNCPNNLPGIFWCDRYSFEPLFPGGRVSPGLVRFFKTVKGARVEGDGGFSTGTPEIKVRIWQCLLAGINEPYEISCKLDVPKARILEQLVFWEGKGLLKPNSFELTEEGLQKALEQTGGFRGWEQKHLTVDEYYVQGFSGD